MDDVRIETLERDDQAAIVRKIRRNEPFVIAKVDGWEESRREFFERLEHVDLTADSGAS